MEKRVYSKSALSLIRFFCIIGMAAELLCVFRILLRTNFTLNISEVYDLVSFSYSDFYTALVDFFCFIVLFILIFFPSKFELFAIIAFIYSIKIITVDTLPENPLGVLLYILGNACLLFMDFYKKHKVIKITIVLAVYFAIVLHSLRFGIQAFIDSLIITFGYSVVMLSTIFFVVNFLKIIYVKRTARVWDLSQYQELTTRDKEWLKQILEERRYDEIARDSDVTVGTLKNRMHQVYNIVGIQDRISLLATYGGYEIKF